jgi:hypothetical protein
MKLYHGTAHSGQEGMSEDAGPSSGLTGREKTVDDRTVDNFRSSMSTMVSVTEENLDSAFFPASVPAIGPGSRRPATWTNGEWNSKMETFATATAYYNILSILCHLRVFGHFCGEHGRLVERGVSPRTATSTAMDTTMRIFPSFSSDPGYFSRKKQALCFLVKMVRLQGRNLLLCPSLTMNAILLLRDPARQTILKLPPNGLGSELFDRFFDFVTKNGVMPADELVWSLIDPTSEHLEDGPARDIIPMAITAASTPVRPKRTKVSSQVTPSSGGRRSVALPSPPPTRSPSSRSTRNSKRVRGDEEAQVELAMLQSLSSCQSTIVDDQPQSSASQSDSDDEDAYESSEAV